MSATKEIELTQGKVALVDEKDYELLNQWRWHVSHWGYAERRQHIKSTRKNQKFKMIKMHRLIMNTPDGLLTDHINGNRLDNRRSNLRICTNAQNSANKGANKNNTSGYKGVTWNKNAKKWMAQTKLNYKHLYIGLFDTREEAAKAYDNKFKEIWREYAKVNC